MALRYKTLTVKRLGWRRIANEFQRLGWRLDDAYEHTVTTETDHYDVYEDGHKEYTGTTTSRKISIILHFSRDLSWYINGNKIHAIDVFFSVFFYLRRILGAFMPVNIVIFLIALLVDSSKDSFSTLYMPYFITFIVLYFVFLILEIIFSYVGEGILKGK